MASVIKTLQKGNDRIYPVTFTNAVKDIDGKLLSLILNELRGKIEGVTDVVIGDAPIDGKAYVRQDGAWKMIDFPYHIMEIDHIPGLFDITYISQGKLVRYPIGAEVYYRDANYTAFYRLYDFVNAQAYWKETSRMEFAGYSFLKGAAYFDETIKIIKQGSLNG